MARRKNANQDICDFLMDMAEYERKRDNAYKYKRYRKAVRILAKYSDKITSGDEAKRLKDINGKIAKKIDEYFLITKKRKRAEDSRNSIAKVNFKGCTINPKKEQKYSDDFKKKIPKDEVQKFEEIFQEEFTKLDSDYKLKICGSYRRGSPESSEIDLLVTHPCFTTNSEDDEWKTKLKDLVEVLKASKIVIETLVLTEGKFVGACSLKDDCTIRRLNMYWVPFDQYYCRVLHFTGTPHFNKKLRHKAHEAGFLLTECSLKPINDYTGEPGDPFNISSEEAIFDFICVSYKKPEDRNDYID